MTPWTGGGGGGRYGGISGVVLCWGTLLLTRLISEKALDKHWADQDVLSVVMATSNHSVADERSQDACLSGGNSPDDMEQGDMRSWIRELP
ncbi:hypothetical protein Hamer_G019190 [Homarus americanus]|uniref:Uncharacterized protein n=1 Tax=Homarus americanus TaxID=6706 RepID=A0A8J5JL80_HOMAM|nr:hypothetical protein Hamer_G019190 [Homarus americanus]